jgi:hypothetical protein
MPLLPDEINDHLPILAETGLIQIPLICETKKVVSNTHVILIDRRPVPNKNIAV